MAISTRNSLAALVSIIIILCLAAFTIRVSSAQQGTQPASAFSGAVWVAESLGLVKLSSTDGSFVFKIGGSGAAKALRLDNKRARAWVYLNGELRAYGFDGSLLLTAVPPVNQSGDTEGDDNEETGYPSIGVVPETGGVWLALNKRLFQFDASGVLIHQAALLEKAVSLSMDDATGNVWVFSKKSAMGYAPSGVSAGQIVFGKKAEVGDGCFDPKSASLWVVAKEAVLKYSTGGALLAERKIKNARRVTASGLGGVWVGGDGTAYLLDQSGSVVLSKQLGESEAKAGAMALNPADLSLWVSFGKNLAHITPSGQVAHYLEIEGKIRALAVYADIDPPVIKFTAPLDGSVTNSQSPSIELAYSDIGSGVDTNSISIKYNGQPFAGTCQAVADKAVCSPANPVAEGAASFEATISDNAGNLSSKATLNFTIDATPPAVTLASPSDGALTKLASATVAGSVSELSNVSVTITSATGAVANPVTLNTDLTFSLGPVTLTEGANTFSVSATDPAGNMGSSRAVVTLDTTPPAPVTASAVTISSPVNGQVTVSGAAGSVEAMATARITNPRTGQVVTIQAGADGSFTASIAAKPTDKLTISLADSLGNVSQDTGFVAPGTLFTASPIDPTTPTNIADAVAFLYTGPDAVQTGVAPGTIDSKFVAVLRGKVSDAGGQPLSGVAITINGHQEYGQTASRDDGMFDIAVNGGSPLAVNYRKQGYLPVQRQINAPWRDYAWAPDVTMIQLDQKVTTVDLTAPATQVAQGSIMTDQDGARQATMIFNPGTTATITLPDGTIQQLTTLNVRATEYTVGPNGPSAMPGELPPTSAYTYAVELSVDEALAQGVKKAGTDVMFNKPVAFYVDNFLGFPVGAVVPVGYYDNDKAAWIASDSGAVIKILGVTGGLADIDVGGAGVAATTAKLASMNFTDGERQSLATMYLPGKTLWRATMTHLSTWDCNWGRVPDPSSVSCGCPPPKDPPSPKCKVSGSIIGVQEQTLGETIAIAGSGHTLNYISDRVKGRQADNILDIPLSAGTVPSALKGIKLEIYVAGQRWAWDLPPSSSSVPFSFAWDGKDAYGREMNGKQAVTIKIGYVFPSVYSATNRFGYNGNGAIITGQRGGSDLALWDEYKTTIGVFDASKSRLGGWSLDAHHVYDTVAKTVYKGDGSRVGGTNVNTVIKIVAGSLAYNAPSPGDGLPALNVKLGYISGMALGPDNALYATEAHSIRRISTDGVITTIAGNPLTPGFAGDGGPATLARLYNPMGISFGPDGSLYFTDTRNYRIRKIDKNGIITTVAGGGLTNCVTNCDNVPATSAVLWRPTGVAVAPDGSFYVADNNYSLVCKVDKNGMISTIAGKRGVADFTGDGGPAANSTLYYPYDVALDKQGNLYISDGYNHRIRKITPTGIINTVAGSGGSGYAAGGFAGDGGPALMARMNNPSSIAITPDGSLLIVESGNRSMRILTPDGAIRSIIGPGLTAVTPDGSPAYTAGLPIGSTGLAPLPNGDIYTFLGSGQIARITNAMPGFNALDYAIPSEDGSTLWWFDRNGKHLQTTNALTGAVIHSFGYDTNSMLVSITDGDGAVTTIQRDGAGNATGIISPYGVRTALTLNANGYLASVTDPGGNATRFTYSADGLISTMTDPNNGVYTFTHDAMGKLVKDQNPAGGSWTLAKAGTVTNYTVTMTSAEGRAKSYSVAAQPNGSVVSTNTSPSGSTSVSVTKLDGTTVSTAADGTVTTVTKSPDPRFGMISPVTNSTVKLPSGLTATATASRAVTLSNPADPLSVSSITDTQTVNAKITRTTFNAVARTVTSTSPMGKIITKTLDTKGRVTQLQVTGVTPITYQYDVRGKLGSVTHGTRTATFAYDTLGNLASIADPLGRMVTFAHDSAGRIMSQTMSDGSVTAYTYDPNGNVTSLTPAGKPAHSFVYTPVDIESGYTPPDIGIGSVSTVYAYDRDKNLSAITRPDGKQATYSYDTAGRLSGVAVADATYKYSYSANNGCCGNPALPASITRTPTVGAAQTINYTYDGSSLTATSWNGLINGSVTRTYDANFRIASRSVNGANTISQTYDNDGFLSGAGSLTITRDVANGRITGTGLSTVTTVRTYDAFDDIASETVKNGATTIYTVQYARDSLGRLSRKTETEQGVVMVLDYAYDTVGRLVGVAKNGSAISSYTYDANGNRLTAMINGVATNGTYDAQDRLLAYGNSTYAYSANGELASKAVNGLTANYVYDIKGNLVSVTLPDSTLIEYVIDGQDRRIGKKINGTLTQGWLYKDTLKPIAELDGAGNVISLFIYGTQSNVPDYMVKGGTTYRLLGDHLGSPRLVIDTTTGAIIQSIVYDEYGNVARDTNSGFQPFGFVGGLYDADTRLTRFGARDYDSESGRWTSKDPIGFKGGDSNLYGYVLADPVNLSDTDGLNALEGSIGGARIGGAIAGPPGAVAGGIVGAAIGIIGGQAIWDWAFDNSKDISTDSEMGDGKKGKENVRNEYYDRATRERPSDPCGWIDDELEKERKKQCKDNMKIQKLIANQKACRNRNKQKSR